MLEAIGRPVGCCLLGFPVGHVTKCTDCLSSPVTRKPLTLFVRVPSDCDNAPAKKSRNKPLKHEAAPAGRSLADWIRDAESQRAPGGHRKAETVHIHSIPKWISKLAQHRLNSPTPTERSGQPTTSERIRDGLEMLWVDRVFWKLARSSNDEEGHGLRGYIVDKYGLSLPLYPPGLWKRLVTAKEERFKLFEIFSRQEWRWLRMKSTDSSERVECELWVKGLSSLFEEYLNNYASRFEITRSMAGREFSGEALKGILFLAKRLAKDAQWCLDNKGKAPPDKARRIRGQLRDVERARRIERLTLFVQKTPLETNDQIAQSYLKENPLEETKRYKETWRKLAGVAKRLYAIRDEQRVRHHVDQDGKHGRRPSRKVGILAN